MTKVNSKSESKSQLLPINCRFGICCQWPKLIQRVKANHNEEVQSYLLKELSMTKVNSKSESKSQLNLQTILLDKRCQWPKLIQRVKANHNHLSLQSFLCWLSMTKVNSKSESKSQLLCHSFYVFFGCQWPKLIQRVKANHNEATDKITDDFVVNDQS